MRDNSKNRLLAALLVSLTLALGCSKASPEDSAVDSESQPISFENSGVWPEVDCSNSEMYWANDHFAVRVTPPDPPWQMTSLSVAVLKGPNGCGEGPVEVVSVVTDQALPSIAMLPLLEDTPISLTMISDPNWADLDDGTHVLEQTLDEPMFVDQAGDLYLVVNTTNGGGNGSCLPACDSTSENHSFSVDDDGWKTYTEGQGISIGATATIEY